MQCASCGKPAFYRVTRKEQECGLCLQCNLLYEANEEIEFRRNAAMFNHVAGLIDMQMGHLVGPTPRIQIPPPNPVALGALNLGNVHVEHSNVGVINTGTIQTLERAVGLLRKDGVDDVANSLTLMTKAIAESPDLQPEAKNQVAEALSVVAEEAAKLPEARRLGVVRSMLMEASTNISGVAALAQLWDTHGAAIRTYFGF